MTYMSMQEISEDDYKAFIEDNKEIEISDRLGKRYVRIPIGQKRIIRKFASTDFELEGTTVWSFPSRGNWATHKGDFRGNWPPQLARNVILRYSKPGELILDQMVGSGTTIVECKLLGRNSIGIDINKSCVMLTRDRLNFDLPLRFELPPTIPKTYLGDARNLDKVESDTIDLIATHPPYANIVPYSKRRVEGDLSNVGDIGEFIAQMTLVASESYRVLKEDRYCCVLIGDTRINKHYVPISSRVLNTFLEVGFILKEDIIKRQWRCKATPFWLDKSVKANFLLIMHEHLFVFRKPRSDEKLNGLRYSSAWE